MIAALLLLASASLSAPAPSIDRCNAIAHATKTAAIARRNGVTRLQADAVADELDPDSRQMAHTLIWYVYESNADGRASAGMLAQVTYRACMASTPNALTEVAP